MKMSPSYWTSPESPSNFLSVFFHLIPNEYNPVVLVPYHGLPDVCQSALGLVLSKLQTVDVLQSGPVLIHLLSNDQLHTPRGGYTE